MDGLPLTPLPVYPLRCPGPARVTLSGPERQVQITYCWKSDLGTSETDKCESAETATKTYPAPAFAKTPVLTTACIPTAIPVKTASPAKGAHPNHAPRPPSRNSSRHAAAGSRKKRVERISQSADRNPAPHARCTPCCAPHASGRVEVGAHAPFVHHVVAVTCWRVTHGRVAESVDARDLKSPQPRFRHPPDTLAPA